MGIQGLLRNLHTLLVPPPNHPSNSRNENNHKQPQPSQRSNAKVRHSIRQFQFKSLAVDASSWLHKAGYACAEHLVESAERGSRDPAAERSYCKYMLVRCDELLTHAKIDKIYLVFDGIRVPLKSWTNAEREAKRQENLREARRLMGLGRRKEASEKYRACVKGNEQMAKVVAGAIERKWGKDESGTDGNVRVKCVWSPYEADAQLAKLCVDGRAHAVVTEDSDVLVYSAVTRRPFPIIYKLDRKDGSCDVVTMDWLVNPTFLAALNGSGRTYSIRRRQRQELRNKDLGYTDSNITKDDDEGTRSEGGIDHNNDVEKGERAICEVEYDDLGLAPVRRALPSPFSSSSGRLGSNRSKRKISSGCVGTSGGNNILLSCLRSFASREASNPGAGVRLFVQACVLSGCDYAPNRLSKVGPVTAFRLVKEASHRDPATLFERALKSLPAGSKLMAEVVDNKSSKDRKDDKDLDHEREDDAGDNMLSQLDNDHDAKEKYEELLSKSQAVFYYHLVRDLATGEIVPLVDHPSSVGGRRDYKVERLEVDKSFRPCTKRFASGMEFLGSAAEASKNKLKPLPPISGQGLSSYRCPTYHRQNNCGWLSTNRRTGSGGGSICNSHQKPSSHHQRTDSVVAALAKETPLEKFLKGNSNTPTSMRALSAKNISTNVGTAKSTTARAVNTKFKEGPWHGSFSLPVAKKNLPHKPSTSSLIIANAPPRTGLNPSMTSTHASLTVADKPPKKSPLPTSSNNCRGDKIVVTSPLLSSVKFDYGRYTPTPQKNDCDMKTKPNCCIDDTKVMDHATRSKELPKPVEISSLELHEDDYEDKDKKKLNRYSDSVVQDNNALNENAFDYGAISEMVGDSLPEKTGLFTEFILRPKSSDDNGHLGPRRVSKSPPGRMKSNGNIIQPRYSPESFELDTDVTDDVATAADIKPAVKENCPNFNSPLKPGAKMKPSTSKRPFKATYPTLSEEGTAVMMVSKGSNNKRARCTVSSSAILAGFIRQQKTMKPLIAATNSNRTGGSKRKESRFFPTSDMANSSLRQKKLNSCAVGKQMKGTPSLKAFMVPLDTLQDKD